MSYVFFVFILGYAISSTLDCVHGIYFCMNLLCATACMISFINTQKHRYIIKSILLYVSLDFVVTGVLCSTNINDTGWWWIAVLQFAFLVCASIFYFKRNLENVYSDVYHSNKQYALFRKPQSLCGYLACFFSIPLGGCDFINGGYRYGFIGGKYWVVEYEPIDNEILVEVEADSDIAQKFLGRKLSIVNGCCCSIILGKIVGQKLPLLPLNAYRKLRNAKRRHRRPNKGHY